MFQSISPSYICELTSPIYLQFISESFLCILYHSRVCTLRITVQITCYVLYLIYVFLVILLLLSAGSDVISGQQLKIWTFWCAWHTCGIIWRWQLWTFYWNYVYKYALCASFWFPILTKKHNWQFEHKEPWVTCISFPEWRCYQHSPLCFPDMGPKCTFSVNHNHFTHETTSWI